MSDEKKKPGVFQRWLGADDVVDQVVTIEDFEEKYFPPADGVAKADSTVVEPFGTSYTVTFDRVGRSHNVAPLVATAKDADELAEKVYDHARPFLRSNAVRVIIDLDELCGFIVAGFIHNAGSFAITTGGGS